MLSSLILPSVSWMWVCNKDQEISEIFTEIELESLKESHATAIQENDALRQQILEKDSVIRYLRATQKVLNFQNDQVVKKWKEIEKLLESTKTELAVANAKMKIMQGKINSVFPRFAVPLITFSITVLTSFYVFRKLNEWFKGAMKLRLGNGFLHESLGIKFYCRETFEK